MTKELICKDCGVSLTNKGRAHILEKSNYFCLKCWRKWFDADNKKKQIKYWMDRK